MANENEIMTQEITDITERPQSGGLQETGYPDGREPETPLCPCCGCECETLYKDKFGRIVGCNNCVETVDAEIWEAEHR